MEAFGRLCVVAVSSSTRANHLHVVLHGVNLWDLKILAYALAEEDLFGPGEFLPNLFELLKCFVRVSLVMGKVNEIKEMTNSLDDKFGGNIEDCP